MDAKEIISDILQIRFSTFFADLHGGDLGADIVIAALDEAGYKIVKKDEGE